MFIVKLFVQKKVTLPISIACRANAVLIETKKACGIYKVSKSILITDSFTRQKFVSANYSIFRIALSNEVTFSKCLN